MPRLFRILLPGLVLSFVSLSPIFAAEGKLSVSPAEIAIGDSLNLTVTVVSGLEEEVIFGGWQAAEEWTLRGAGEVTVTRENGQQTHSKVYRLTTFETGPIELPPPVIEIRRPGDVVEELSLDPVVVMVRSVLQELESGDTELRPLKAPIPEPVNWWFWGSVITLILLLLGGAVWWYRRQSGGDVTHFVEPPAHERALAALEELRAKDFLQKGLFEEYYTEISAIVRRYIEDRFGLKAPEMTTEEFLHATAGEAAMSSDHKSALDVFLNQCDLVKFARYRPQVDEAAGVFDAARKFIIETQEQPLEDGDVEI